MVGKKQLRIILIFLNIFISCEPNPRSTWTFYWELYNAVDSTRIKIPVNYIFNTIPCNLGDCNISRESDSSGFIAEWLLFYESKDDFLANYPKLESKILYNEEVIFDSLYIWSELNFNLEFYDPYNQFNKMVGNYQKIYLNIPE